MTEGKFYHLTDLCHLVSATTNIIVANTVSILFVFALDGLSLSVDECLVGHSTEVARCYLNHFELNRSEVASNCEAVTFHNRAESLIEVRLNVDLSQVSSQTFNSISKRQNLNLLRIWKLRDS